MSKFISKSISKSIGILFIALQFSSCTSDEPYNNYKRKIYNNTSFNVISYAFDTLGVSKEIFNVSPNSYSTIADYNYFFSTKNFYGGHDSIIVSKIGGESIVHYGFKVSGNNESAIPFENKDNIFYNAWITKIKDGKKKKDGKEFIFEYFID